MTDSSLTNIARQNQGNFTTDCNKNIIKPETSYQASFKTQLFKNFNL